MAELSEGQRSRSPYTSSFERSYQWVCVYEVWHWNYLLQFSWNL